MKNAGTVIFDEDLFLRQMDFVGGKILAIRHSEGHNTICITIEHPDMPTIEEADIIPNVQVLMTRLTDSVGRYIVTRTDPPKSN